jgi:hypothetical protein
MTSQSVHHGRQIVSVTAEDAAERIRALTGDRSTPDERERRMRRYKAIKGCTHCVVCWTPFAPGQRVYRELRFGRDLAPVCEGCRSQYQSHDAGSSCDGCGRIVHNPANNRRRRRTFCCAKCKIATRSREKHARVVETRGTRECQQCGETFEPARADAKFCSLACKQKHYRRRVTDAVFAQVDANSSRNGHGEKSTTIDPSHPGESVSVPNDAALAISEHLSEVRS